MSSIAQRIRNGELPNGYEISLEDIGRTIDFNMGAALPIDLYKKVYIKPWGMVMENNDQRNARKSFEYHCQRNKLVDQLKDLELNQILARDLSYGDTDGVIAELKKMGRYDEGVREEVHHILPVVADGREADQPQAR